LIALAGEPGSGSDDLTPPGQSEAQMVQVLKEELFRCRRRLERIDKELKNIRYLPSVELSIEVKMARRQGRNLLGEIAADLEKKVARRIVERDMLKMQFDQLGPEAGFINIKR
jgi:hypothetical protein